MNIVEASPYRNGNDLSQDYDHHHTATQKFQGTTLMHECGS
jgi:hypothetical protein